MKTLTELETLFSVSVLDHLDREVSVPTVTSAACQGDVSFLRVTTKPAVKPVPKSGVAVVRGENGGNTHSLHGDGPIFWDVADVRGDSLVLGTLTVPDGSTAYVIHPEHGGLAIQPGTYSVGRQREWAGEWRMVQD